MQKLIGSSQSRSLSSASFRERSKDLPHREQKIKSSCKREPVAALLDIGTVLEMSDELSAFPPTPVLIYSTKYRLARNRWLWEFVSSKGYFVHKTRVRETVLRPVLRLYNSVTDVTSDLIAFGYDYGQPTLMVRSRRLAEPYCRLARHTWLQHKMLKRPPELGRLVCVAGVVFTPPYVYEEHLHEIMSQALQAFQELHDHVGFPVVCGLNQHIHDVADFLKKMHTLRDKCRNTVLDVEVESKKRERVLPIQAWPWTDLSMARVPYEADDDDVNVDSGALAAERHELHASRDVSVCLLYRLVLITHSVLQYLVFINVGEPEIVQEPADEVLVVSVRQQLTESVLEMFLDPSTRVVDALFEAIMSRASALVLKGATSKQLRVRTLQQCRLGSAVASWQLATQLLTSIGEAFAAAVLTEVGRDERTHKYCHDCLNLIPRFKDDCLYQVFRALSLRHRKLSLLKAQHTEPLDPLASRAVTVLTKITITYALHLFRTEKVPLKHAYMHEQDLQDDFASFLAYLRGWFSVVVPQPPTSVHKMTGGRLRAFMTDMLVAYYKEVVEPSAGDTRQTAAIE
ncbi:hypothetical protein V5799_028377 [Amblyomma americanum]|uniref:Uncharacterized protein n=1 Tax=Amblyomma americanum TaxID=6943 RepID=A0AAQ4DD13_AMBAM